MKMTSKKRPVFGGNFGSVKILPVIIALAIVSTLLIIRVGRNSETRREFKPQNEPDQHWKNYIPESIQYHWNWIANGNRDPDTSNCNFEDYVMGQPVNQSDPCLVATFKKKTLLDPPPLEEQNHEPLNITEEIPSNIEKFKWIEKLLLENSKEGQEGFFIECGANDGEFISPTIRLEKQYNWTGLLIEANPIPFKSLVKKKRNAWTVNAAACTSPHPTQVTFYTNPRNTGLSGLNARVEHGVSVNETVQCIPLYTMLAALEVKTVDYLSLDVEGLELAILKTVPFDKVTFKVMTIEYGLIPGRQQALKDFLEPKGYRFVKEIRDSLTLDCLYVHESLYEVANKTTF